MDANPTAYSSGVSYLPQHTVTQKRGIALALAGPAMIFYARSSLSLLASSARLRILQTSSNAVDIAWMSCGPNTLPSKMWNDGHHGPPTGVQAETTKGIFRARNARGLSSPAMVYLCAFWVAWRARISVRIRTHKALSRPDRRRVISFVVCITCIMQGFGDANSPVTCVAKQLCGFWRTLLRNWRVSFGFAFDFCVNFRADHYDD